MQRKQTAFATKRSNKPKFCRDAKLENEASCLEQLWPKRVCKPDQGCTEVNNIGPMYVSRLTAVYTVTADISLSKFIPPNALQCCALSYVATPLYSRSDVSHSCSCLSNIMANLNCGSVCSNF
jgi:hypothetical protein